MSQKNFYDTGSFLKNWRNLLNNKDNQFFISSITLEYLEENEASYANILNFLKKNDNVEVIIYKKRNCGEILDKLDLPCNLNTQDLACAIDYEKRNCPDNMIFYTNKLSMAHYANLYFGKDSIIMC